MRLLVDEDSQRRILIQLLRAAGHDVLTVNEAGLNSQDDDIVFSQARQENRIVLTRNVQDFKALHNNEGRHPGILVEHQNNDPAMNMKIVDIVQAIGNIEASGWNLTGQLVALNAWNYPMKNRADLQ